MEGLSFLFIADSDAKGEIFLLNLIQSYVSENITTVLVLLDALPRDLLKKIIDKESKCFFVVNTYEESFSKYYATTKLHELKLTLKAIRRDLKKDTPLVFVFWSLNPLFIAYKNNDVINFFMENVNHAIHHGTIEFHLIGKGVVDDITMRRLIAVAHCVIQLENFVEIEEVYSLSYLKTVGLAVNKKKVEYKCTLGVNIWNNEVRFAD